MIRLVKDNKLFNLRHKIINILMNSGKKNIGEKILLKSFKSLQRSSTRRALTVFCMSVVNSTSAFKINEQATKKGKRKAVKIVPSFVINDSLRIANTLKSIKRISTKSRGSHPFYQSFLVELLSISDSKSKVIEQKIKIQRQILTNKRYLTKFRW